MFYSLQFFIFSTGLSKKIFFIHISRKIFNDLIKIVQNTCLDKTAHLALKRRFSVIFVKES